MKGAIFKILHLLTCFSVWFHCSFYMQCVSNGNSHHFLQGLNEQKCFSTIFWILGRRSGQIWEKLPSERSNLFEKNCHLRLQLMLTCFIYQTLLVSKSSVANSILMCLPKKHSFLWRIFLAKHLEQKLKILALSAILLFLSFFITNLDQWSCNQDISFQDVSVFTYSCLDIENEISFWMILQM